MFDDMWLPQETLRSLMEGRVFHVASSGPEDRTCVRLRTEIIEFLRCPLVGDASQANVLLRIGDTAFDSDEAYTIRRTGDAIVIEGNTSRAVLYGFYAFLRATLTGESVDDVYSAPSQAIRMVDHWDQTDGSVERGYSGASILFGTLGEDTWEDPGNFTVHDRGMDPFRHDRARLVAYARFLASVGLNAVAINNVNVRGLGASLIEHPLIEQVKEVADVFDEFGIATYLSVFFGAPRRLGGLDTSDPLDPRVRAWWAAKADAIYALIPRFGGFLVKADSEGEPGPYQYGRDHADGANMLAEALAPHGGTVIWRAFVYNSSQDWRDRGTDRARAAFDNFKALDGRFAPNVALQVKFGPIDFQNCEPLNTLIGGMERTNVVIEFEITAEYLGHQIDVNYSVPQWIRMINTDTGHEPGEEGLAKNVIRAHAVDAGRTGFAAVQNVGMDRNWTGNKLAQANFYGFGRMCWDDELDAGRILDEWIAQAFPVLDGEGRSIVRAIQATSNQTYIDYTAPLGVGFMTVPHYHYGPSVDGYEYDRWGTYHFADRDGVGVDRTQATGTGYTAQYAPALAARYEDVATAPDETLLFFHHVPYTHVLHDGTSVIQHIYDTHFRGVENVRGYVEQWDRLRGRIPDEDFDNVNERLGRQLASAIEWRDQINTFFYRMSGIPDEQGRTIHR